MRHLALWSLFFFVITACSNKQESSLESVSLVEAAAQLTLISGNPEFGEVEGSKTVILSIRNTGDAASEIPTPSLIGTNASAFSILLASGCSVALPKNGTCTVRVNFNSAGKAGGAYVAALKLGATPALQIPLTASVALPPMAAYKIYDGAVELNSSLGVNFGNLSGSQSGQKILTLKNTGGAATPALDVSLTNNSYSLSNNTCQNKILAPNQSCSFKILFSTVGKSAQVYLSDILIEDIVFPLAATVLAPLANDDPESGVVIETYVNNEPLTTADLNLGLLPNNQGIAKVLTFKNVGTKTSTPMTAALSENNNFFIVSNQCYEKVLAPGQSCSFRLIFSAVSKNAGEYNVNLTFPGVELPVVGEVLPTAECPVNTHLEGVSCEANVKACSIENGVGAKTWNGSSYGDCVIVSCNSTFHEESGSCLSDLRSCVIANGAGQESWLGNQWSSCTVQSCEASFHAHNNQCDADVISCVEEIANASTATKTWGGEAYGACDLQACNSSYHEESNACLADIQDCSGEIANSTAATKTWNGSAYDACVLSSCDNGFMVMGNACEAACDSGEHWNAGLGQCQADVISCVGEVANATVATKTWDGSAYGSCVVSACAATYQVSPDTLACVKPQILMAMNTPANGFEAWTTDGTASGTTMLFDLNVGSGSGLPPSGQAEFVTLGDKIIFAGNNGVDGLEPFVMNKNNPSSATMLKNINPTSDSLASFQAYFTVANGLVYFRANGGNGQGGAELWATDGTPAGTYMVKDIFPGNSGSSPSYMTEMGGKVYFQANDGTNGTELWVSDGTAAGTYMIKNINPSTGSGPSGVSNGQNIPKFLVSNGKLYFVANEGSPSGIEPWVSDGTEAGTHILMDILPGVGSGMISGTFYAAILNKNTPSEMIYFADKNSTIYSHNPFTGVTSVVKDINNGVGGAASPRYFFPIGNKIYFSCGTGVPIEGTGTGLEPCVSDGTSAGTKLVKDINLSMMSGSGVGSNPQDYVAYNGYVYFVANGGTANGGTEIWRTDGTSAGTTLFMDLLAGSGNSGVRISPTLVNNKLMFLTNNTTNGYQLWLSDGTVGGTAVFQTLHSSSVSGTYFFFPDIEIFK